MTRNPLVHNLVLPIALVGSAACVEPNTNDRPWGASDGSDTAVDGGSTGDGNSDTNRAHGDSDSSGGDHGGDYDGGGDGDGDGTGDGDGEGDSGGDGDGDGDGDGGGDGDGDQPMPNGTPTEENLRVAFIGDQGHHNDTVAVLDLIKAENAAFLVIAGDFDYGDNPQGWDDMNVASLGADYPVFAVVGNHDKGKFGGQNGYQSKLIARRQNAMDDGATCDGEAGRNSVCSYKGLFIAMSGVDIFENTADSADYLRNQLAQNDSIWSICVWHKNMNDMQLGTKTDDVGWGVYQACQDEAGIVITGHEHSYERTMTLNDLGNEAGGHGATGEPQQMVVSKGSTYVSVVGLGGRDIRNFEHGMHDDDTWWASVYTSDVYVNNLEVVDQFDAQSGALFIDFYVDKNPNKAHAYFKNVNGDIIDEYDILRE